MAVKWTGYKKHRPEWTDGEPVRKVVRQELEGTVLNFPAGRSPIGDVRADVDESVNPDVMADLEQNPFGRNSFDTVYCDPPYGMYWNDQSFIRDLWNVAREKLILQTPSVRVHIPETHKEYILIEPKPGSSQRFVKMLQIITPANGSLF